MTSPYAQQLHRVQTAIAALLGHNPNLARCTPKHLRVGVDMSKADMAGLADLLIRKGVFTLEEYLEAITASAKTEADSYVDEVRAVYGNDKITTVQ